MLLQCLQNTAPLPLAHQPNSNKQPLPPPNANPAITHLPLQRLPLGRLGPQRINRLPRLGRARQQSLQLPPRRLGLLGLGLQLLHLALQRGEVGGRLAQALGGLVEVLDGGGVGLQGGVGGGEGVGFGDERLFVGRAGRGGSGRGGLGEPD